MENNNQPAKGAVATNVKDAAQAIYDEILTKIIVDVACGVHRAAKTGRLPYSDIMAGSSRSRTRAQVAKSSNEGVGKDSLINNEVINRGDGSEAAASTSSTSNGPQGENKRKAEEGKEQQPSKANQFMGKNNDDVNKILLAGNGNNNLGQNNDSKKRKVDFTLEGQQTTKLVSNQNHLMKSSEEGKPDNTTIKPVPGIRLVNSSITATDKYKPSFTATLMKLESNSTNNNNHNNPTHLKKIKTRTDIYGRTPGKEPTYLISCPNDCGRRLSCGRMAFHLEKCLGLSNTTSTTTTTTTSRKRNSSSAASGGGGGRRGSSSHGSAKDKDSSSSNHNHKGSSSSGNNKGGNASSKSGGGGKVSRQGKQAKQAKRKGSKVP